MRSRTSARVRLLVLSLYLAGSLALIPIYRVYACSCMPATEAQLLARADIIFIGVVAHREDLPPEDGQPNWNAFFTFALEESVKGPQGVVRVGVVGPGTDSSCGRAFTPGQRWRIAAKRTPTSLVTGPCGLNELLEEDAPIPAVRPLPLLDRLSGDSGEIPTSITEQPWPVLLMPVIVVLAAIALIAAISIVAFRGVRQRDRHGGGGSGPSIG